MGGEVGGGGYEGEAGVVVTGGDLERIGEGMDEGKEAEEDRLGQGPFAVRSSAAAEDLPDASYAGLYETYLNVERDRIGEAARRCFPSAAPHRVSADHAGRLTGAAGRAPGAGRPGPRLPWPGWPGSGRCEPALPWRL